MHILKALPLSLLLALSCLSLLGCKDPAGTAELDDYQQRLARVLALEIPAVKPAAGLAFPAKSALQQPLPELRIDLLDAFATRSCGLDMLIAERNSSMGKVFTASKRLDYEVRFLATLERCLQQDWQEPLKSQLAAVYQEKAQSIDIALNNMLQTDNTLRKRWLAADRGVSSKQTTGFNETLGALQQFVDLKQAIARQDWYSASKIDPEAALQVLHHTEFLSELQFSLRYANSWFATVNPALLAIEPASLCPRGPTEQLTILSTVFRKYFIIEVQAYLAELTRYQQQSWPLILALYEDSLMLPVLTERYHTQAEQLQQQLLQHIGWYQQLNQSCPVGLTG